MRKRQEEAREKRYCFRLSEQESMEFEEQRDVTGLTVSEYVRRRVLGFRVASKVDLKVYGELRKIHGELRKLGGLAKHIYAGAGGMYSRELADVFQALKSCIRNLERYITNDLKNSSSAAG